MRLVNSFFALKYSSLQCHSCLVNYSHHLFYALGITLQVLNFKIYINGSILCISLPARSSVSLSFLSTGKNKVLIELQDEDFAMKSSPG